MYSILTSLGWALDSKGASVDAGGRIRISQLTTLFDGKTLNSDNTRTWHKVGNGTVTFANNTNVLSVTAGQYVIRQSNNFFPYFSGKSQIIEFTFDNFHSETGLSKKIGYFSSSATAPYNTIYDGFYIEATATSRRLVVTNNGTELLNLDWTLWDNYADIIDYDWSKFGVIMMDFLWLGGTDLRLFLQLPNGGFQLVHTYQHAGNHTGTFIKSPNQPIRYEVRSTTGIGYLTCVCSQVSTEGSNKESGESLSIISPSSVACNLVGTVYALKGIKKQIVNRDIAIRISEIGCVNSGTTDNGILMLLKNPTLSAPLTYVDNDRIQEGTATTQTVTTLGSPLVFVTISSAGDSFALTENQSVWLQNRIDNTLDEYVIAYRPITTNQSLVATVNLKIFT